jgi:threonine dehydrogenase-like Zn-dependent dehydrogenase/general stress protein YciG
MATQSGRSQQQSGQSEQVGRGGQRGQGQQEARGFAAMDPDRQREIAAEGGRASHEQGTGHEFDPEEAREAGRKSHQNGQQGRDRCWHGKGDVRVDTVPDPKIQDPGDVIVRITATAITCGSDLHLFDGFMPTMEAGDILGHEPMGVVVEVGSAVTRLKKGDRVVVPFVIACGSCFFCKRTEFSCCDTSNPNAEMAREAMGHSPAGLFGFSHMLGGFAGGQAEYLRVPHADVGPIKIESGWPTSRCCSCPTSSRPGTWRPRIVGIEPGDTVAVWGCGPVGQFAIRSAWMLGAGRVIAIDRVPERLRMAAAARPRRSTS